MGLREFRFVAVLLLALNTVGCTDRTRTSQRISARLDRIDVLIEKKDWKAAESEMTSTFEETSRLSPKAPSTMAAFNRLNRQAELIMLGLVQESRAELERTHISVANLFATFDAKDSRANRSYREKRFALKAKSE